ncbi:hypothetical protein PsW64_03399 [Pseudovibrio sp. W64]|nr:hypothetical protein PsW64_03399 [Pseudovibrio sp. W64]KZK87420.1 hypothetical protein PsAD13_00695 [Pseudovibrio sp. Ad13]KZK88931.1 hypothetical protein PsAD5_05284 [Pseudovibrio sp. Ad5]KZK95644.1 hypothetical protein PsAD46_00656 [Pseudovibrio sp. Ad46]KZK99913.1 hypothetical protein PsW74_02526 [Pseudovibrio sp. W74]KZL11743.1 hypothetical protein PsAD14_00656 [Pseudovibrio sp. Ad14]KZL27136.1 hypothetical protein PsWM33_01082 [Pseudovibrio sp. WM33]
MLSHRMPNEGLELGRLKKDLDYDASICVFEPIYVGVR